VPEIIRHRFESGDSAHQFGATNARATDASHSAATQNVSPSSFTAVACESFPRARYGVTLTVDCGIVLHIPTGFPPMVPTQEDFAMLTHQDPNSIPGQPPTDPERPIEVPTPQDPHETPPDKLPQWKPGDIPIDREKTEFKCKEDLTMTHHDPSTTRTFSGNPPEPISPDQPNVLRERRPPKRKSTNPPPNSKPVKRPPDFAPEAWKDERPPTS